MRAWVAVAFTLVGVIEVTAGAATKVKALVLVADPPFSLIFSCTVLAVCAGVFAVTFVGLPDTVVAGCVAPNVILSVVWTKCVPLMVTFVPPATWSRGRCQRCDRGIDRSRHDLGLGQRRRLCPDGLVACRWCLLCLGARVRVGCDGDARSVGLQPELGEVGVSCRCNGANGLEVGDDPGAMT